MKYPGASDVKVGLTLPPKATFHPCLSISEYRFCTFLCWSVFWMGPTRTSSSKPGPVFMFERKDMRADLNSE